MPPRSKPCCAFEELRENAFTKAETGRFQTWQEVAKALDEEGCRNAAGRLRLHARLLLHLDAMCRHARAENSDAPQHD